MKIKKVEHSPLPQIQSIQTTRLILSKSEWNTIVKANKIMEQAQDTVYKHLLQYYPEWKNNELAGLSDIDQDLDQVLNPYQLSEFLEQHNIEGLKIN